MKGSIQIKNKYQDKGFASSEISMKASKPNQARQENMHCETPKKGERADSFKTIFPQTNTLRQTSIVDLRGNIIDRDAD